MSAASLLLAAAPVVPLLLAVGCAFHPIRASAAYWLPMAPLPAFLAALLLPDGTTFEVPPPLRLSFALDGPGAILLGGSALLWSAAGLYAGATVLAERRGSSGFAVWWLMTLAGSLGVFIASNLIGFYLFFTLASLAAYGLITHDGSASAGKAGRLYVSLAVLGEACLLLALVMLAAGHPDENPTIQDAVRALAASPLKHAVTLFLILGLGLKMGLVPLHVWLPLAHPAAPIPASAVLSGVLVKAGVVGFIRFLPFESGMPTWGAVLTILGLTTAYFGALIGLTQTRPKTVLAYSTVSQMGLVAVLFGVGLELAEPDVRVLAAYYAVHHMLVKGALFLALGVLAGASGPGLRLGVGLTIVLALSLGGMPLTSGALAKVATKPLLGYGLLAHAMNLAAAGSTLLMLHFLAIATREFGSRPGAAPLRLFVSWLIVVAAAFSVPWSIYPAVTGETVASLLAPAAIWKVAWPMLIGGVLMLIVRRLTWLPGLVPEGDILAFSRSARRPLRLLTVAVAAVDRALRTWTTAGLALAGLTVLLAVSLALK